MIQKKRLKSVQKGILAGLLAIIMLLAVPFAPALYANDPRDGLIGVWRGTYINNHGLNGCEFLIFRDGPNFRAVVHFFPVEGSPAGQASGSTLNDITFDPATGLFEIIPILYLDMPAGWSASGQTMGLYGDTIMGHIRGSEQFWVSASRVSVTDFPTTINHEHINAGGMCAFCLAPMAAALPIAPLAAANQTQAAIAAGFASSYAITGEGMLWTWGANDHGQLGQGNFGGHRNHPLHIRTNIVAVAAGSAHVLAIDNTGGLWAWGANDRGQVGDGTFFDRNAPVRIMDNVTHVAAGSYHSVAITANGNVWTWGANGRGQLGNGTTSDFNFPIMVMSGASAISAGLAHTLAIANNALHAWGWNDFGQLGDGTFSERHTPTLIMANVAHVAAGSYHTLAITDDGWLHAWGLNEQGRLGDGTTTNRNLPTRIMPNASAISAGTGHSLALTQDNMLWSWGLNWHGQIGDGTITDRNTPAAMMSNITAISAGGHHSMAVAADGGLWTWGGNADGQIGDGSTTTRRIPVSIMGGIMPQAGAADLAPVPHIAPVTQDDAEIEFDLAAPGEYIYTLTPAGRLFAPSPAAIASVTDPMTAGGAIRATAQNLTEEQRDSGDAMNLAALHIENLMRRGSTRGLPMDGNIHAAILEDIRDVARDIQDETSAVLDDENLLFMRRMRTNLNFVSHDAGQLAIIFPEGAGNVVFDSVTAEADFAAVTIAHEHIRPGNFVTISLPQNGAGIAAAGVFGTLTAALTDFSSPLTILANYWFVLVILGLVLTAIILAITGKKLRIWVVPTFAILAIAANAGTILLFGQGPGPRGIAAEEFAVNMTSGMQITLSLPVHDAANPHNLILFDSQNRPVVTKFNPVTGNIDANIRQSGIYFLREYEAAFNDIYHKPQLMQDAIVRLASRGIMPGLADGYFVPADPIAREDFIFAIATIFDMEYANFDLSGRLSKEEMTVMAVDALTEHMGYRMLPDTEGALDILYLDRRHLTPRYELHIALATAANILTPRADNLFAPESVMTRGDAAVVLYRVFNRVW